MESQTVSRRDLIAVLTQTPHGKLQTYIPIATKAVASDPEFYAHLTAWNSLKGSVRDAKVALPVLGLGRSVGPLVFRTHHLGLVAGLVPREFLRAVNFAKDLGSAINQRMIRRLVERYLREYEADPAEFEYDAMVHGRVFQALYTRFHIKPSPWANENLIRRHPVSGRLAVLRTLKDLSPVALADAVVRYRLPFQQVHGAIGAKVKEPDVLVALIQRMTAGQLVSNLTMLKKLGVESVPAARAALEAVLAKNQSRMDLKAGRAAKAVEEAGGERRLAKQVAAAHEKALDARGIDGDWLVLTDCSGSMEVAIASATHITATLARLVRGRVRWILFNDTPRAIDATGKTLAELQAAVEHVQADGGTSIGCGLRWVLEREESYDGIVLVSDGAENAVPYFAVEYERAAKAWDKPVPVYWYHVSGDAEAFCRKRAPGAVGWQIEALVRRTKDAVAAEVAGFNDRARRAGIEIHRFDLTEAVDYYSLPNLVQTMRANRYSLVDEILDVALTSLDEALPLTKAMPVVLEEVAV